MQSTSLTIELGAVGRRHAMIGQFAESYVSATTTRLTLGHSARRSGVEQVLIRGPKIAIDPRVDT